MDHSIEIDESLSAVRIRVEGTVAEDELLSIFEEVLSAAPRMNRLWDYSEADLAGVDSAALRRIADYAKRREGDHPPDRVAVVVGGRPLDFGITREYIAVAETRYEQMSRIFTSIEEAEAWLRSAAGRVSEP